MAFICYIPQRGFGSSSQTLIVDQTSRLGVGTVELCVFPSTELHQFRGQLSQFKYTQWTTLIKPMIVINECVMICAGIEIIEGHKCLFASAAFHASIILMLVHCLLAHSCPFRFTCLNGNIVNLIADQEDRLLVAVVGNILHDLGRVG